MPTVLVLDDDRCVLHAAAHALRTAGWRVLTAARAAEGMRLLEAERPDAMVLDLALPGDNGLAVLKRARAADAAMPVVAVTCSAAALEAIEAMKAGAYEYLLKPLDLAELRRLLHEALASRQRGFVPITAAVRDCEEPPLIGCDSPAMLRVCKAVGRVAGQDVTVLIHGESGTGKELIARAIYRHSRRCAGPFLAVNCAAIPESLLESELFGHERGAFTGADSRRIGKFEQCHGGTIFLDEVGDMSPLLQSKVLRVLQEQRFERVGGNRTIETNVRIIAATNRHLEQMVADGQFRSDLYYRLGGFTIALPPLRQRREDLQPLIEYFLALYAREMNKDIRGIAPEALQRLRSYHWPGNVRQLQSVLRHALLHATGPVIVPACLPEEVSLPRPVAAAGDAPAPGGPPGDLAAYLDQQLRAANPRHLYSSALALTERYVVTRVLRLTEGNQSRAARILGITRGSLRNKIRALGLSIGQVVQGAPPSSQVA